MNVNYINSIVCGHLLVAWAVFLNVYDFNKGGIALALFSLAIAYVLENLRAAYIKVASITVLEVAMVVSLLGSYLKWLF